MDWFLYDKEIRHKRVNQQKRLTKREFNKIKDIAKIFAPYFEDFTWKWILVKLKTLPNSI